MRKKLSSLAASLGLLASVLITSGAQAQCYFGPVSASTNDNSLVSSSIFGNQFVFYGQNQGTWASGGFTKALTQRYDSRTSVTSGVHGAAYTTELQANGSYVTVTTPYSNLQDYAVQTIYPSAGSKIAAIQVQIWYCE